MTPNLQFRWSPHARPHHSITFATQTTSVTFSFTASIHHLRMNNQHHLYLQISSWLFLHPLPNPSHGPTLHWSPLGDHLAVSTDTMIQVYSNNHRDNDTMEFSPGARIRHAECLYSWLWISGSSSTSSSMLELYTCNNSTDNQLGIQLESTYNYI